MMIPKGWKKKNVGCLFDVQLGKMLSEKAKTGKQYPYLANFNVRWGSFDFSKTKEMSFSARERKKYTLQHGDLLMCEGGEIGRCAIWRGYDKEIYYQKALHRIRPLSDECSNDYLYIFMQFIASQGKLTRLVGETSIAHLTREKLLGLPIILPSPQVQKAIAEILSIWDLAIEKTELLIQAKERQFKWIMTSYINHNEKLDWQTMKLRDVCSGIKQKNSDGETNVLTSSAKRGLVSQLDYYKKSVSGKNLDGYYLIKHGHFAYNRSSSNGYPFGAIKRLDLCDQGVLSTLYLCFSLNSNDECNSDFLVNIFESGILNCQLRRICQEGARSHGLLNVTKHDFFDLDLLLPPLSEQKRIAKTLKMAQQEIDLLKTLANKYKYQKRGLMQKLLMGTWRVPNKHKEV